MLNTKSLEFYKKLVNSGAKESLAQSIVEVIEDSSHLILDELVTKDDLKNNINELRLELKNDIRKLELDMDAKFDKIINNMNSKFQVIYVIGGLVSAILVTPVLNGWLQPIIARLLNH